MTPVSADPGPTLTRQHAWAWEGAFPAAAAVAAIEPAHETRAIVLDAHIEFDGRAQHVLAASAPHLASFGATLGVGEAAEGEDAGDDGSEHGWQSHDASLPRLQLYWESRNWQVCGEVLETTYTGFGDPLSHGRDDNTAEVDAELLLVALACAEMSSEPMCRMLGTSETGMGLMHVLGKEPFEILARETPLVNWISGVGRDFGSQSSASVRKSFAETGMLSIRAEYYDASRMSSVFRATHQFQNFSPSSYPREVMLRKTALRASINIMLYRRPRFDMWE
ncbi:uncharacterized protein B0I36DRAFT_349751 [Microdochium trichocladiopsis]|uniref:Uncharacterized protein n=1 Tax=Microdochium trichocladiopsis TaxID=1682393 RepID=A0A9P8Y5X9_9PEZI|nr:uncharacterized protein B0I36DRAFT_349751 [Microdochium trichocladiopsis]KAH7028746.1 hypothetical protein B0I36DRAFT_349751 [Microdochium trichocladiopsis]